MHPTVQSIAFLLGKWQGEGKGVYPTIDDFDYGEEIEFRHTGKPFLVYTQRTWSPSDGTAMHSEMGFWRPQEDGRLEVVLAHPFGSTEVLEGTVDGTSISLASTGLLQTSSAKEIRSTARELAMANGDLVYTVSMELAGQRLQNHLTARLRKVG